MIYNEFSKFIIYPYFFCQPAIRPGCVRCMNAEFYTTKISMLDLPNYCSEERLFTAPWCYLYNLLLLSFYLHITYRKVRNLQIGTDKFVGKVLIKLLHHAKFITSATCVISIIINAPLLLLTPMLVAKLSKL